MKRLMAFFVSAVIGFSAFGQLNKIATATIQLDSIVETRDDGSSWEYQEKVIYHYNAKGQLEFETEYDWRSSAWEPDERNDFTYDLKGNVIELLIRDWDSTYWENYDKYTFAYNSADKYTQIVAQYWDNGAWENDDKEDYMYNSAMQITSILVSNWDNNAWENDDKYDYFYNSNNKVSHVIEYDWDDTAWFKYYKEEFIYNSAGQVELEIDWTWSDTAWIGDDRDSMVYDANGWLIQSFRAYWSSYYDEWRNFGRDDYTYDANGNLVENQYYSSNGGSWDLNDKEVNQFDLAVDQEDIWMPKNTEFEDDMFYKNKIQSTRGYEWNGGNWLFEDSIAFHYSAIPFGIAESNRTEVQVYPNPASSTVFVKGDFDPASEWMLYDNLGKQVMVFTLNNEQSIDVSELAAGLYILKLNNPDGVFVTKIIKQ